MIFVTLFGVVFFFGFVVFLLFCSWGLLMWFIRAYQCVFWKEVIWGVLFLCFAEISNERFKAQNTILTPTPSHPDLPKPSPKTAETTKKVQKNKSKLFILESISNTGCIYSVCE